MPVNHDIIIHDFYLVVTDFFAFQHILFSLNMELFCQMIDHLKTEIIYEIDFMSLYKQENVLPGPQ